MSDAGLGSMCWLKDGRSFFIKTFESRETDTRDIFLMRDMIKKCAEILHIYI